MINKQKRGILLAVIGSALWGTSGTAAELLYKNPNINTFWLIGVRLWLAGLALVVIAYLKNGKEVFNIFHNKRDLLYGMFYAVLGIVLPQFTYFYTVQLSNAPTGTVLVFLAPVLIIFYMSLKTKQLPRRIDMISVIIAIVGTIILVTGGNFGHLAVTPQTLVWGFMAAVTQACSIVMPGKLFKKYGSLEVIGLSMIFGAIIFTPFILLIPAHHVTVNEWATVFYIVIAGTILAYTLYLSSVMYISAGLCSMLEAFEPLTATVLSVSLLGSDFGLMKMIGGSLIIIATCMQVIPTPRGKKLFKHHF